LSREAECLWHTEYPGIQSPVEKAAFLFGITRISVSPCNISLLTILLVSSVDMKGGEFKFFFPLPPRKFSRKETLADQENLTLWNCMQLYRRQVSPQYTLASLILLLRNAGKRPGLGNVLRIVGRAQEKWKTS